MGKIDGAVALVTGAGRGIGRAIALRLAREDANVALLDVDSDAVESVASEVHALGSRAMTLVVDLYNVSSIPSAIERVAKAWGCLDVLVNNAGIIRITPLFDVTEAEWDQVLDLNLKSTFFCLQAAARVMATQNRGRIVNIASISGLGGRPDHVHYAASKAGVINLTCSAALALASHGITVNAICPGIVDTPLTRDLHKVRGALAGLSGEKSLAQMIQRIPLGRIATPDDIAAAVTFLVSDDAGYITGQVLCVEGGMRLASC